MNLACRPNFYFLGEPELTLQACGVAGSGCSETNNKSISVQLNLTVSGTDLGNLPSLLFIQSISDLKMLNITKTEIS